MINQVADDVWRETKAEGDAQLQARYDLQLATTRLAAPGVQICHVIRYSHPTRIKHYLTETVMQHTGEADLMRLPV